MIRIYFELYLFGERLKQYAIVFVIPYMCDMAL